MSLYLCENPTSQARAGYTSTNREPFRIGRLGAIGSKVGWIEGRRKVNLLNFSHEISEVPFHLHPRVASPRLHRFVLIDESTLLPLPPLLSLSLSLSLSLAHTYTLSLTVLFFLSFVGRLYRTVVNVRPNVFRYRLHCATNNEINFYEKKRNTRSICSNRVYFALRICWNFLDKLYNRTFVDNVAYLVNTHNERTWLQSKCNNNVLVETWKNIILFFLRNSWD